jgi:hypothetical protein
MGNSSSSARVTYPSPSTSRDSASSNAASEPSGHIMSVPSSKLERAPSYSTTSLSQISKNDLPPPYSVAPPAAITKSDPLPSYSALLPEQPSQALTSTVPRTSLNPPSSSAQHSGTTRCTRLFRRTSPHPIPTPARSLADWKPCTRRPRVPSLCLVPSPSPQLRVPSPSLLDSNIGRMVQLQRYLIEILAYTLDVDASLVHPSLGRYQFGLTNGEQLASILTVGEQMDLDGIARTVLNAYEKYRANKWTSVSEMDRKEILIDIIEPATCMNINEDYILDMISTYAEYVINIRSLSRGYKMRRTCKLRGRYGRHCLSRPLETSFSGPVLPRFSQVRRVLHTSTMDFTRQHAD